MNTFNFFLKKKKEAEHSGWEQSCRTNLRFLPCDSPSPSISSPKGSTTRTHTAGWRPSRQTQESVGLGHTQTTTTVPCVFVLSSFPVVSVDDRLPSPESHEAELMGLTGVWVLLKAQGRKEVLAHFLKLLSESLTSLLQTRLWWCHRRATYLHESMALGLSLPGTPE